MERTEMENNYEKKFSTTYKSPRGLSQIHSIIKQNKLKDYSRWSSKKKRLVGE